MDKKLGKNLVMSIGYNLLTMIVPFITAPYLGRVLGAENVGSYTYVHSISAYFVMFGMLGFRNYGNRTIARVRDNYEERSKAFSQVFSLQLLTGGISCIAYVFYLIVLCRIHQLMALIVGLYVMTSLFTVVWFLEGMEQFSTLALRNLIIKLVNLVTVFIFVRDENDVVIYCLLMSVLYLAAEIMLWPSVLKKVKFKFCKWMFISIKTLRKFTTTEFSPIAAVICTLIPWVCGIFDYFIFKDILARQENVLKSHNATFVAPKPGILKWILILTIILLAPSIFSEFFVCRLINLLLLFPICGLYIKSMNVMIENEKTLSTIQEQENS